MANLVMDAWLWSYPTAQIAVTNWGGFRAEVPAGEITWGNVIDVLPFDNNLVTVDITGAQLAENLLCCGGAVGGIAYQVNDDTIEITLPDLAVTLIWMPPTPSSSTTLCTLGVTTISLVQQDGDGYSTNVHWRQPVIDYILSLETSASQPLDDLLDETVRVE